MYWNSLIANNSVHGMRLIETWDVLKWNICKSYSPFQCRLIETWDVLKSTWILLQKDTGTMINRNMRCIEIVMDDLNEFFYID